jgi:hypothetical protein
MKAAEFCVPTRGATLPPEGESGVTYLRRQPRRGTGEPRKRTRVTEENTWRQIKKSSCRKGMKAIMKSR